MFAICEAINQIIDGYGYTTSSVSADYTMTLNDTIILMDATGGNKVVTLKPVDQCKNKRVTIKKTDASANTVTIDGNDSEVINNATTYVLTAAYQSIDVVSDGSKWWAV
jgi:hypothetical protein